MLSSLIFNFTLYCILPMFVFFLALTLALRDFDYAENVREFLKNCVRRLF